MRTPYSALSIRAPTGLHVDTHLGQLAVALAFNLVATRSNFSDCVAQVLTSQASTLKPKVNVDFDDCRHDIHLVLLKGWLTSPPDWLWV